MRIALRWLGYGLAGLLVLALLAAAWVWHASSRALADQPSVLNLFLGWLRSISPMPSAGRARSAA